MAVIFDKYMLKQGFTEMANYIHTKWGTSGEIYLVGGAAIAMEYNPIRLTRDADARIEHNFRKHVIKAAKVVGAVMAGTGTG